jgi:phosphatidylinositol glycan class P protein
MENENSTELPHLPDLSGRSRAPEFYGFVAWTSTSLAFCLYILWALVPDKYILWVGIDWYPNRFVSLIRFCTKSDRKPSDREWALLIPAWSIMLIITTYIVYSAMAIAATPSFSEMRAITGE